MKRSNCAARHPVDFDSRRNLCRPVGDVTNLEIPNGNLPAWLDTKPLSPHPVLLALGVSGLDVSLECGTLIWEAVPMPTEGVTAFYGIIADDADCGDSYSVDFNDGERSQIVGTPRGDGARIVVSETD